MRGSQGFGEGAAGMWELGAPAGLMDLRKGGVPEAEQRLGPGQFRSALPPGYLSRIPSVLSGHPHLTATSLEQWAWLEKVQAEPEFKPVSTTGKLSGLGQVIYLSES